jgi:hypothetical protein
MIRQRTGVSVLCRRVVRALRFSHHFGSLLRLRGLFASLSANRIRSSSSGDTPHGPEARRVMTARQVRRASRWMQIAVVAPLVVATLISGGHPLHAQVPGLGPGILPDTIRKGLSRPIPLPATPPQAVSTSVQSPAVLTLDTAVALALFASANARTEGGRSYSGILPSVTAGGGRTVTAGDPLVGARAAAPWNTQFETLGYQLQTSLNLLGAVSAYPGIRSAEYVRQTYDLTLERTRQSVALDVSQAFLQTVLDSELVVIAAQNVTVSQEQVVQLQELVRVGKRPPADQYQAQAQASANQSIYLDAVNRQRAD